MKRSLLFALAVLLCVVCVLTLAACEEVRSIEKAEIVDGELIVTYTDGTTENIGTVAGADNTQGLDFYPLPDGTYGVKVGKALYLEEITIPATYQGKAVTTILPMAFCNSGDLNTTLKRITIPEGVTTISDAAFAYCVGLNSITLPASVTSIGVDVFERCYGLENITVEIGSQIYRSAGNCLIEIASKTLIYGCKNSAIPSDGSVRNIGEKAFQGSHLTEIIIPSSVTTIGVAAFEGSHLTEIIIPSSVTTIGDAAFHCRLNAVYYGGSTDEWDQIFSTTNVVRRAFTNMYGSYPKFYCYSADEPTAAGDWWWYYDSNGQPAIWPAAEE